MMALSGGCHKRSKSGTIGASRDKHVPDRDLISSLEGVQRWPKLTERMITRTTKISRTKAEQIPRIFPASD
jgi:hypothetical protein